MDDEQGTRIIRLRNAKLNCKDMESAVKDEENFKNCLVMQPDTGETYINDLTTVADGGSKIKWLIEEHSGIKKLDVITETGKEGSLFLEPPSQITEEKERGMKAVLVGAGDEWNEGKYLITYTLDDGKDTEVTIDPMIRIPPK